MLAHDETGDSRCAVVCTVLQAAVSAVLQSLASGFDVLAGTRHGVASTHKRRGREEREQGKGQFRRFLVCHNNL